MKRFVIGMLVAGSLFCHQGACPAGAQYAGQDQGGEVVINVAFAADSLPFSFVGQDKAPAGYSIDLCSWALIARIGQVVGNPVSARSAPIAGLNARAPANGSAARPIWIAPEYHADAGPAVQCRFLQPDLRSMPVASSCAPTPLIQPAVGRTCRQEDRRPQ